MQRATETESQTALMGTSCLFTLCHTEEKGMAPSLENAYAILTEENNAKSQWGDLSTGSCRRIPIRIQKAAEWGHHRTWSCL